MSAPYLSSLSEYSRVAGSAGFRLTATGSGFFGSLFEPYSPVIIFDGVSYPASNDGTDTSCWADIPASALTTARTVTVYVETEGGTSTGLTFTVTEAVPTLTSITPASVTVGESATIDVYGTGLNGGTIHIGGTSFVTTEVSSTQLRATLTGFADAGVLSVTVVKTGVGTSNGLALTVSNPVPAISGLSPTSATVGGSAFTLTITGSGFTSGSVVRWNGVNKPTTLVSSTQLTASIPSSDLNFAGNPTISVFNTTPGGGTDSTNSFTISNPAPSISGLSPASLPVGTGATTITVTGANLVNGTVVRWNGNPVVTTTYVDPSTVRFTASASMLSSVGNQTVTLYNASPGGGESGGLTFSVSYPVPVVTSVTPSTGMRFASANITVGGGNFFPDSVIHVNGYPRTTVYGSGTSLQASLTEGDVATASPLFITVVNPSPGGGESASGTYFYVLNPAPSLTSISPASRTVGSSSFTLTASGSNFVPDSVIQVNGSNRATTFISTSQLTAVIPSSDQTTTGNRNVTVHNPSEGGGTTPAQTLAIVNPVPVISGLSPTSATRNGSGFTLVVSGGGFVNGVSVVRWGGSNRATTFVSSTQITAVIPYTDLTSAGQVTVTVYNAGPGGGTSNNATFTVNNPVPTITSISPASVTEGSGALTLTVNGTGFLSGESTVHWNGNSRSTTFVSGTQLTASIPASDVTSAGSASITVVTTGAGGGTSNGHTFYIGSVNPVPTITGLSPTNKDAGSGAFTLTVSGTNFVSGAVVQWAGSNRPTTFVSATSLTATITSTDVSVPGTFTTTVVNPSPGGGPSGNATFIVNALNPVPSVTTISPASAIAGASQLTLTVDGAGFVSGVSVVRWNGSNRTTTFVSSTRLTAVIPSTDLVSTGSIPVTVFNSGPGGGTSGSATFIIQAVASNPVPTLSSMSPSTKMAGDTDFTLAVSGTGFVNGSVVRWNGSDRVTTYVNSTSLTAAITTSDLATAGNYQVTVFSPTPGGGLSNGLTFAVLAATNPVPRITSLSPSSVPKGNPDFTLSVFGTGMIPSSTVALDGTNKTSAYVSPTRVDADVPSSDVERVAGTVSVINPKAHVSQSTVNAEALRAFTSGTAAAPAITVGESSTDTGLYSPADGEIAIASEGLEILKVDADGVEVTGDFDIIKAASATLLVHGNGPAAASILRLRSGDGTTSPRNAYVDLVTSEASPQGWLAGMFGSTDFQIYDATAAATRLKIDTSGHTTHYGDTFRSGAESGRIFLVHNAAGSGTGHQIGTYTRFRGKRASVPTVTLSNKTESNSTIYAGTIHVDGFHTQSVPTAAGQAISTADFTTSA
jgi:hypothetical protein